MDNLSHLLTAMSVKATVFHNGQYCGNWAVDTSGSHYISFHAISHGQCFIKRDGSEESVPLSQGDMVIFPKDAKHVITSDSSFKQAINQSASEGFDALQSDGTGLVCGYFEHNHPLIDSIIQFLPEMIVIPKDDAHNPTLSTLTETLLTVSKSEQDGTQLLLERISDCIFTLLLRDYIELDRGILAALNQPKLAPAINAIFEQPAQKWTVEGLAEKCFVSRTGFATLFKETMLMSPMEFITQWRMGIAHKALREGQTSTLAAALDAGYESEASFSKAFKRVFGVTPGSVRAT